MLLRISALSLLLLGAGRVFAQAPDPVDSVERILRLPSHDVEQRRRDLTDATEPLRGLRDLRVALLLPEWRDRDVDPEIADVDRALRAVLMQRFEQRVHQGLGCNDPMTQIAVADMLADLGASAHAVGNSRPLASGFGSALARLAQNGEPVVSEAAVRALGRIHPDVGTAVPALSQLLRAENLNQRLAAANALVALVRVAAQLATGSKSATGVEISRQELIALGIAVVPLAAQGLADKNYAVRRSCIEAIGRTAAALNRMVPDPPLMMEDADPKAEDDAKPLMPLMIVLRDSAPMLARALADPDRTVRAYTRRTLEVLAEVRQRWQRRADNPADDPLLDALRATLPGLSAALVDADLQARRTSLNVLEALGSAAAPALPALVQALDDSDRFVRWGAARALGKLVGEPASAALPGLIRLLNDADLDLRLASATTLQHFGRNAAGAVPTLVQVVQGRNAIELRVAAIHALDAIGLPHAQAALPALIVAIADPDEPVRLAAIALMGKMGAGAHDAVDALRRARTDRSPQVQQAASAALLQILQAAPEGRTTSPR
ncbi:MAG: HEAT repeat domain-containing protein [Gemmataceae bacterium]|nr:HEAT repeat domain-containing protein [Gemmataceae bacterium]